MTDDTNKPPEGPFAASPHGRPILGDDVVDELGKLRHARSDDGLAASAGAELGAAAQIMMVSMQSQKRVQEFQAWILDAMPVDEFADQAHSLSGSMVGGVLGAWFDAGASLEVVKEYLGRLADVMHAQYAAAKEAFEASPPIWASPKCSFANTVDPKSPCGRCGKGLSDA